MTRIIFFDGPCNLCNYFVQRVIKHDKNKLYKFASLQSNTAQLYLTYHDLSQDTVVYLENQQSFLKSTAVLKILENLGWHYKIFSLILKFIPTFLADKIYDLVAQNRSKFFTQQPICDLVETNDQSRFLN